MIKNANRHKCCGCSACASVCPIQCIKMTTDKEGFLYPKVEESACVSCGACEMVCPMLHPSEARMPQEIFAVRNNDEEVLKSSSSGGVFSLLAQYVLDVKHGAVFGAMWDGEGVVHGVVEKVKDLWKLRGSKYVQSRMGNTFLEVKHLLRERCYVMFVGTPCQVAGLRSFLKEEDDRLLTVDLACHGVPSPKVLASYIAEIKEQNSVNELKLNFRDKSTGWDTYSVSAYSGDRQLFSEKATENIYMRGYLHELFSRPSCHACPFKSFRSGSDITLADFWGVKDACPEMYDRRGASLVLVHSDVGQAAIKEVSSKLTIKPINYEQAVKANGSLFNSEEPHPERTYFFKHIDKKPFVELMNECLELRRITRLKLTMKAYLRKIGVKWGNENQVLRHSV